MSVIDHRKFGDNGRGVDLETKALIGEDLAAMAPATSAGFVGNYYWLIKCP